jgi:hypothetical protein
MKLLEFVERACSSLTLDAVAIGTRKPVFQLKNLIWQVVNGSNGGSHTATKPKASPN